MRIGIDARFLGADGGIARYITELVKEVGQAKRVEFRSRSRECAQILPDTIVLFLKKSGWDSVPDEEGIEKVMADVHWYGLGEQLKMPGLIRAARVDLMHFPHWNVPLLYRGPFVLTLHDLILRDFPAMRATTLRPIVLSIKYLVYRVVLWLAIQRARRIIVPSQYVRDRLACYYPGAEKKAAVVHEGVTTLSRGTINYQLSTKNYLLYVGNAYPHKNLERLVRVWKTIDDGKTDLILAGGDNYFYPRLKKYAQKFGSRVTFFGRASDEELAAHYRSARAVIVPSLSEGFGLPGLEAMSAGVPVVAARASCLPEIYGDAALWFDPTDEKSMTEAMLTIMTDEGLRHDLIEKGLQQIKRYSWQRAAEETIEIYAQARS